jgi:demethylsterigmatocystin 6-O-methyltransferase
MTPAYNAIPKFLATTTYRNPSAKAPFNLAYNTDQPVFEWRKHNPENAEAGQAFMAAQRTGQQSVWDGNKVPLTDLRLSDEDLDAGRVLLVDVGGGFGHQCIDLRKLNPHLKGRMITQDLSFVHDMRRNADELLELDIEPAAHDFMQPQPVRGAKAYYLRNVIHNWNDAASELILKQVRGAMAEDSVLIVDDVVMPRVGASWKQASMDIAMMTMLAAMERTEEQFRLLLLSAGLRLRDVWTYDDEYGDSLLVAVPV